MEKGINEFRRLSSVEPESHNYEEPQATPQGKGKAGKGKASESSRCAFANHVPAASIPWTYFVSSAIAR